MNDQRITARDTQRVIKFRAWDGERMYMSPSSSDGLQHLGSWFEAHSIFGHGRIKESIIMAWTGLLDKHGKEIRARLRSRTILLN